MMLDLFDFQTDAKNYLLDKTTDSNEIKDSIEERKLEVVTIPDYYFTEELREVNEL